MWHLHGTHVVVTSAAKSAVLTQVDYMLTTVHGGSVLSILDRAVGLGAGVGSLGQHYLWWYTMRTGGQNIRVGLRGMAS